MTKVSFEIGKEDIIELIAEKFKVKREDVYHLGGTLFRVNNVEIKEIR